MHADLFEMEEQGRTPEEQKVVDLVAASWDDRLSTETLLKRIASLDSFLSDDQMLLAEQLLRRRKREKLGALSPVVREVRVSMANNLSFQEMLRRQFASTEGDVMTVRLKVENPNYGCAGAQMTYRVDVRCADGEIVPECGHVEVELGQNDLWTIASCSMYLGCESAKPLDRAYVSRFRVSVCAEDSQEELAGVDVEYVHVPAQFEQYVAVPQCYLFQDGSRERMVEQFQAGAFSYAKLRVEVQHVMEYLDEELMGLECCIIMGRADEWMPFSFRTMQLFRSGGSTYACEEPLLSTCPVVDELVPELREGRYDFSLTLWGEELLSGSFHVGDQPKTHDWTDRTFESFKGVCNLGAHILDAELFENQFDSAREPVLRYKEALTASPDEATAELAPSAVQQSSEETDFTGDDFDKLLDEFIARELVSKETDGEEEKSDCDSISTGEMLVREFWIVANSKPTCKHISPNLTLFRLCEAEFFHIHADIVCDGEPGPLTIGITYPKWGVSYTRVIKDPEIPYDSSHAIIRADFPRNELFDQFPEVLPEGGSVMLMAWVADARGEHLYDRAFYVLNVNTYADCLQLTSLNLFKSDCGDTNDDWLRDPIYTSFAQATTHDIVVRCLLEKVGEIPDDRYEIIFSLFDQMGRLLEEKRADVEKVDAEGQPSIIFAHDVFGDFTDREWEDGFYRLEVSWLGEVVASVRFDIGDKDVEGVFDMAAIQPRIDVGSRKVVQRVSDARIRLDQLVGLGRVKEKITSLSEMSSLATLRRKAGLPAKRISLHARFVGNSGTGKTTVAEIIGQLYKEMGLLSKGHVVYEERRTLIGRYYDSELRETERALRNAKGGILFIDEAYTLYAEDDPKDPGRRVLEALLTALSDENDRDWMLVLAGYPDKIDAMLESNQGLKSRVNECFIFDDYTVDELMQIADLYCRTNSYLMTPAARRHLQSVVTRDHGSRGESFGNGRYVKNLLEQVVLPRMAVRLRGVDNPTCVQLQTIEEADVPSIRKAERSKGYASLDGMVGLHSLKSNIASHLNFVKMANQRMQLGIHTAMPPLHMVFTGNPGTGKTTVADFMGEIYASMGILSQGDVIRVEKSDLVGVHVGETEQKVRAVLNQARGNILFIDEAYQLCASDGKADYGVAVIDTLLTTLSNDSIDMIVILAGYTDEMERLLAMNAGLRSRFPYVFHFEDYSVDELLEIARLTVRKQGFTISPKALKLLHAVIRREIQQNVGSFGNARFVTRLVSTCVLPAMATRLAQLKRVPTRKQLTTIIAEDIPISPDEVVRIEQGGFDEKAIDAALKRLDTMVGLQQVKTAVHNFVEVARYLNGQGERFVGNGLLKWSFLGNTGTGKSSVAKIMAELLKAMNLLGKGNLVEIKGEQLFNVPDYQCDEVLRKAMMRSRYGLLFIDGDAPAFRNPDERQMTGEQLRIKLSALTAEIGGNNALIIAECESPRQAMARALAGNGIYDFDHTIIFDDYSPGELFEILCSCLAKYRIRFSPEAAGHIRHYIDDLCDNRELSFANARTMKILSRTICGIVLLRESKQPDAPRGLVQIGDVESFEWRKPYRKLGY